MESDTDQAPAAPAPVLRRKPGPKPKIRTEAPAAPAAEAEAAVAAVPRQGPMLVKAKHPGTYPNLGDTYPRYRKRGEMFPLQHESHFTTEWMEDASAELEPQEIPGLPQTTGPRRVLPTHPPLQ